MADNVEPGSSKGEQYITISSIRYYTILEGPENAPVIILIHALMANNHIYDSVIPILHSMGYRTFRYDHIGHNKTSAPTDPIPHHFDFFTTQIDQLYHAAVKSPDHYYPAAIIGCSIGGVLAMNWALTHPLPTGTHVKIISMAAPGYSTLPGSPEKWQTRIAQWEQDGNNKQLAAETLKRWFPNEPKDFDREKAREMVESCTLEGYRICADATMDFDYTGKLSGLKDGEDIMILVGADDGNIGPREIGEEAARMIKGSRYVRLEGVGHIPPMHEEFVPFMRDFLGNARNG